MINAKKIIMKDRDGNYLLPVTHSALIETSYNNIVITLEKKLNKMQQDIDKLMSLLNSSYNANSYVGIDNKNTNIAYIMGIPVTTGIDSDELILDTYGTVTDGTTELNIMDALHDAGVTITYF
jgi:hypothetical protein